MPPLPGPLEAVEVRGALDADVVGFGGPGGEDDLLGGGADEGGDLGAGVFDDGLGLPAEGVGARVGVAVRPDLGSGR